jgi:hypothetical protein
VPRWLHATASTLAAPAASIGPIVTEWAGDTDLNEMKREPVMRAMER